MPNQRSRAAKSKRKIKEPAGLPELWVQPTASAALDISSLAATLLPGSVQFCPTFLQHGASHCSNRDCKCLHECPFLSTGPYCHTFMRTGSCKKGAKCYIHLSAFEVAKRWELERETDLLAQDLGEEEAAAVAAEDNTGSLPKKTSNGAKKSKKLQCRRKEAKQSGRETINKKAMSEKRLPKVGKTTKDSVDAIFNILLGN